MNMPRALFLSGLATMAVAACLVCNSYGDGFPPPPTPSVMPADDKRVPYECPRTKYIDCMPPIQGDKRHLCSPEYLDWVRSHCPGVEVVY